MGLLIIGIVRWILKHFLTLLIIILVLALGGKLKDIVQEEIKDYQILSSDSTKLINGRNELDQFINNIVNEVTLRMAKYEKVALADLNSRITDINREIKSKTGQKEKNGNLTAILMHRPLLDGFAAILKLDVEIKVLEQERVFLTQIRDRKASPINLEQARQKHISAYAAFIANQNKLNKYKADHPVKVVLAGLHTDVLLSQLEKDDVTLRANNHSAKITYDKKFSELQSSIAQKMQFNLHKDELIASFDLIEKAVVDRENKLLENWVTKARQPIEKVLPTALMLLLSVILVPIGIKAIFFYILTPIASRRPPIVLLPNASGLIDGMNDHPMKNHDQSKITSVSVKLAIEANQELLIHSEFIQSSTITGEKDTKWLMDYSFPWSSLLSGMFALTRIRSNHSEVVVLSASKDPLLEVGIISLPVGSSVVLQPRSLIGVAYDRNRPVRITRHWRIFSLHAWLTLQLRYLVFHGPSKLIVKGCRGVRVERADTGRLINQAATIGFCANLKYSTSRCDTFTSYLLGKQELLNDSFAGSTGYYIYEETPNYGKHAGITGRGLEGFTDAVLKVFGV